MVKTVALVPARGGSKGIPRKNLQLLAGKSILQHAIDTARAADRIDEVVVSTDSEEIMAHAMSSGAQADRRPAELAQDGSLVIDCIRDFWKRYKADHPSVEFLVLLEPTSPFRTPELIDICVERVIVDGLDSLATFHEADINPERTWKIEAGLPRPFIDGAIPWKPRQMLTPAFQLNGLVYVMRPDTMPADSISVLYGKQGAEIVKHRHFVDIDTIEDLELANALFDT